MDDLISRQDAINALYKEIIKRRLLGDDYDGMLDEFTTEEVLKKVPPAQPERWIQCTERMPDNERDVLVTVEIRPVGCKPFRRVVRAFYTDGKHMDTDSAYTWYDLEEPDFDDDGNIIVPEGWWESSDYSEEVHQIDDFVISWREQPKPWEEEKAEGAATP